MNKKNGIDDVNITVGSRNSKIKRKKGDIDVIMIVPSIGLSTKLRKMAKDNNMEMGDITEKLLNEWFILKRKDELRIRKDSELKEKRKAIFSDLQKNIRLLEKL